MMTFESVLVWHVLLTILYFISDQCNINKWLNWDLFNDKFENNQWYGNVKW